MCYKDSIKPYTGKYRDEKLFPLALTLQKAGHFQNCYFFNMYVVAQYIYQATRVSYRRRGGLILCHENIVPDCRPRPQTSLVGMHAFAHYYHPAIVLFSPPQLKILYETLATPVNQYI